MMASIGMLVHLLCLNPHPIDFRHWPEITWSSVPLTSVFLSPSTEPIGQVIIASVLSNKHITAVIISVPKTNSVRKWTHEVFYRMRPSASEYYLVSSPFLSASRSPPIQYLTPSHLYIHHTFLVVHCSLQCHAHQCHAHRLHKCSFIIFFSDLSHTLLTSVSLSILRSSSCLSVWFN